MAICKGCVVQSMTKIIGVVIEADYSTRTVVIQKYNGGVCACPMSIVTVISYDEVQ